MVQGRSGEPSMISRGSEVTVGKKHKKIIVRPTHYTTTFSCCSCHDIFLVHQVPKGTTVRNFLIDRGFYCPACGVAPNIMVQE